MLGKILGGGELGQWASFVTPAFFEVMPRRALWRQVKALAGAARDHHLHARVVAEQQELLARSRLDVVLLGPGDAANAKPASQLEAVSPDARAARVVELYFLQLAHGEHALLDLRHQAFSVEPALCWRPASWIVRWDPSFIAALRQLYSGFYRDDATTFRAGLDALHLSHAEAVFRRHFGEGQRQVRFEVKHFVATFHEVFVRCRDAGTRLHPDFLPLGLYLASLYDHLERLGVAVDVAAAFDKASVLAQPLTA